MVRELKREGSFFDKKAFEFPSLTTQGWHDNLENDLVATAGEFIGTVLFLFFGLGARQNITTTLAAFEEKMDTASEASARLMSNFYVSAAFGLALYSTATIFYRFTGSIFNPAIALSLFLVGSIKPLRFTLVCIAQIVGGIVANGLLALLSPDHLEVDLILGEGTSRTQGLFIEMFTTANLTLSVLMLGAEKHLLTPHAPLGFAFTLWAMMLYSTTYTGAGMNPARAFGTSVISGQWQTYHWIYWFGPILGAMLATGFYLFLKSVHYWDINPGQDSTGARQDEDGPRPDMAPQQASYVTTAEATCPPELDRGESGIPSESNPRPAAMPFRQSSKTVSQSRRRNSGPRPDMTPARATAESIYRIRRGESNVRRENNPQAYTQAAQDTSESIYRMRRAGESAVGEDTGRQGSILGRTTSGGVQRMRRGESDARTDDDRPEMPPTTVTSESLQRLRTLRE